MTHYIVDGLFVLVGILFIAICAKRGFFLSLLKFCKTILAFGAAYLFGGKLGAFVGEKFLNDPIHTSVFNKINSIYLSATEGFSSDSVLDSIPKFLQTEEFKAQIAAAEGSGEELVASLSDTISSAISSVVCAVIGYVAVFLVAVLALSIVYALIRGLKEKLKLLGFVDSLLGAVLGFVLGWIVLLAAGSILKFFFVNDPVYTESVIAKFFGESSILESIKMLNFNEWLNKIQSFDFKSITQ